MLPMIPSYCMHLHSPGTVGAHGETQGLLGEDLKQKLGQSSAQSSQGEQSPSQALVEHLPVWCWRKGLHMHYGVTSSLDIEQTLPQRPGG